MEYLKGGHYRLNQIHQTIKIYLERFTKHFNCEKFGKIGKLTKWLKIHLNEIQFIDLKVFSFEKKKGNYFKQIG